MLFDPRQYVGQVEDGSCVCADRVRKRLEREGAEIERKSLESRMRA
jgi:hypothetical protein